MSLGGHLGVTSFSGVCLGQENYENVVFGEGGSGDGFLVRGWIGWKAKVVLSCKRECKIHDLVFLVFQALIFTPQIDVCVESSRQLVSGQRLLCRYHAVNIL